MNEQKYRIKGEWIFNLEAMHDKLWCILYDIQDGELALPIEIAGTLCKDEDDIQNLIEEAERLEWIAKSRKVTSKEYGRIKQMAQWRATVRYMRCLASGMSEAEAGKCFEDM